MKDLKISYKALGYSKLYDDVVRVINLNYSDIDIHTNKLTNISTNKLTNISTIIHKLNININHLYIKVLLKQKHYFIYFNNIYPT